VDAFRARAVGAIASDLDPAGVQAVGAASTFAVAPGPDCREDFPTQALRRLQVPGSDAAVRTGIEGI